jgi:hypothetical protein
VALLHHMTKTIALAAVLAACAAQGAATTASQRNVVTAQELSVAGDVNLYQALERVRPTFLRPRIGGGTTGVQSTTLTVFYDGMQMMEGLEHLREIAARNVQEVRFLEPQQANARFGGNHSGGAIVIVSKK